MARRRIVLWNDYRCRIGSSDAVGCRYDHCRDRLREISADINAGIDKSEGHVDDELTAGVLRSARLEENLRGVADVDGEARRLKARTSGGRSELNIEVVQ